MSGSAAPHNVPWAEREAAEGGDDEQSFDKMVSSPTSLSKIVLAK